jgi:DNA invertase Pin-like site-specific DNA recombinase
MLNTAQRQRWTVCVLDVSVDTSTPNGRLVANILISVAEWESAMIGLRTSDAMAEAKLRGASFGRARSTPREIVARIVTERSAGGSFAGIARRLDTDEVPTPSGGQRWYTSTVARIHRAALATTEAA